MSLLITNAGIAASIHAGELGVSYKITHIAIGLEGYLPTLDQTQLKNEVAREALTRGSVPVLGQLHFEAVFADKKEFEGKEIGYYLEDGTLFAVDSRDGEILSLKRSNTIITEALELNLAGSSIENITVEIMGTPYASEAVAGIAKIAAIEQMNSANDETIVTPKKLKDTTATDDDIDTESNEAKFIQLPQFWRGINTINSTLQFLAYDAKRTYREGEICFTKHESTGALSYWQWYSNVESLAGKNPELDSHRRQGWSDTTKPWYWSPFVAKVPGETMLWDTGSLPEIMVLSKGQQLPVAVYHRLARAKPEWVDELDSALLNIPDSQGRFSRSADGVGWIAGETHEDEFKEHAHSGVGTPLNYVSGTGYMGNGYKMGGKNTDKTGGEETMPKAFIEYRGYVL